MGVEQIGQFGRIRKNKKERKEGRMKRKTKGEERGKEKNEKWVFRFSLRSTEIGPSLFVGV